MTSSINSAEPFLSSTFQLNSVSQQLVYKVGQYRPRTLGNLTAEQLTVAPGHVVVNDLQTLKDTKFPELSWKVDDKKGSAELMEDVIEGKLDYTIADSVAISLFQRVHPELAVALDITDEQPVTWFSPLDGDNTLSAALLDFFNEMNEDGTLARIEEKYLGHGIHEHDFMSAATRQPFHSRAGEQAMGAMSDLSALNLEAGSLVGGYTLISRLGSGAMGSVWRVRDDGYGRRFQRSLIFPPPLV